MKHIRLPLAVTVLMAASSAFAIKGKSLYHYYAYEAAFWPKGAPMNAAQYVKLDLDPVANAPFDTLVFAPVFGFGSMAGILSNANYPTQQPSQESKWMRRWQNAMPTLAKAGVDPIAETSKWCRKHKKEAVVALPVNFSCTHSQRPSKEHTLSSWYSYLWPDFKSKNSDCLINPASKASGGKELCVDYTHAKVRDKFAAIATEITTKYDIDGIMVDFMMQPILFKSVVDGGTAAPKELQLITDMMTKIKGACKAASARLGHPVAFAARVPDSLGYCKDIGIDLQGWLDGKLLDFVVLGGNFQLSSWSVSGAAAQKAGVPYYASFTQSGIHVGNDSGYYGDDERLPRNSRAACCARMADVLLNKGAGCMFTMGTHWDVQFPRGLCAPYDAKANRTADKRYFVSYTNDRQAGSYLKDGMKHLTVPSLLSGNPVDLSKGSAKYQISVWDDVAALKKDGLEPKLTLVTEISIPSGMDTSVMFNGKELKPFKKRAGTQLYDIPPMLAKFGANEVMVKAKGKNKRGQKASLGNIAVEVTFPKPGQKGAGK